MTGEQKKQFTARISQANKTQLVVILYDMTLCYLQDTKTALEQSDDLALEQSLERVRGCINELMLSLHTQYEVARNVMSLYLFCLKCLVKVQRNQDKELLARVQSILERLGRAYEESVKGDASGPEMTGIQNVYEGLTYGKNGKTMSTLLYK